MGKEAFVLVVDDDPIVLTLILYTFSRSTR